MKRKKRFRLKENVDSNYDYSYFIETFSENFYRWSREKFTYGFINHIYETKINNVKFDEKDNSLSFNISFGCCNYGIANSRGNFFNQGRYKKYKFYFDNHGKDVYDDDSIAFEDEVGEDDTIIADIVESSYEKCRNIWKNSNDEFCKMLGNSEYQGCEFDFGWIPMYFRKVFREKENVYNFDEKRTGNLYRIDYYIPNAKCTIYID